MVGNIVPDIALIIEVFIGFNIFYQHRIFDWFIRAGLFGNFPIANRTISLVANSSNSKNTDSKDKKSSSNDLSLTADGGTITLSITIAGNTGTKSFNLADTTFYK